MTREKVEQWLTELSELVKSTRGCILRDENGEDFAHQITFYEPQIQITNLLEVAKIAGVTLAREDNSNLGLTYPIGYSFRYNGCIFCEVMTKEYESIELSRLEEIV